MEGSINKKKKNPTGVGSRKKVTNRDIEEELDLFEDECNFDTVFNEDNSVNKKLKLEKTKAAATKEKDPFRKYIPIINIDLNDSKEKKNKIHLDKNFEGGGGGDDDDITEEETEDEKKCCFLCDYYSFSKDTPSGPVKIMLTSMEQMFAQAGSSIESIAEQTSKYYEENIYLPCVANGQKLPELSKEMITEHFYKHICHNPEVHLFTSFITTKTIQRRLLNTIFYYKLDENGQQVDNNECFDPKKIDLFIKLQLLMDKMLSKDPSKQAFGKERSFDVGKKGNYLNYGEDIGTEYNDKFNQY